MFDKFGFLKSHEELNAAAAGFLKEGDTDSIMLLAEENGIDKEDAQDYADEFLAELVTPVGAALGRLKILKEQYIDTEKNTQYRANKTMIKIIIEGMVTEPEVAAGIMKSENIVADMVDGMKKAGIYTGTDEDLRKMLRACVTGAEELSKVAKEIKARYE